jgi:hypothetical protein
MREIALAIRKASAAAGPPMTTDAAARGSVALLNDKVRAIPGVRRTETFTYLRLFKQTYAWGTR